MPAPADVTSPRAADALESLRARALVLADLGRWRDAAELLERALALDPAHPDALGRLGTAAYHLGDFARALELADRHVALTPHAEWPHRKRSVALLRLGRYAEALAAADEAVRLAPDDALPHHARHRALRALGGRDAEARAEADRILTLAPDAAASHVLAADAVLGEAVRDDAERRDARWVAAERHARDALALDAGDDDALHVLACALRGQGRAAEGADVALALARRDPERGDEVLREVTRAHLAWRRKTMWWWAFLAYYWAVYLGVVGAHGALGHGARFVTWGASTRLAMRWLRARRLSPEVRAALRARYRLPGQHLKFALFAVPFLGVGLIVLACERVTRWVGWDQGTDDPDGTAVRAPATR